MDWTETEKGWVWYDPKANAFLEVTYHLRKGVKTAFVDYVYEGDCHRVLGRSDTGAVLRAIRAWKRFPGDRKSVAAEICGSMIEFYKKVDPTITYM